MCVRQHISRITRSNFVKFHRFSTVGRFSSGRVAICYAALLLLWITLRFILLWTQWWRVATAAAPLRRRARANTHAARYWFLRVLDDGTGARTRRVFRARGAGEGGRNVVTVIVFIYYRVGQIRLSGATASTACPPTPWSRYCSRRSLMLFL